MNLGKHFFNKTMRGVRHCAGCHGHDSIASSLIKAATVAAGVYATNEIIKKHYNPEGIKGAVEDFVSTLTGKDISSGTRRIPYADNVIAKLAACSYVAKIDNTISNEEQAELDMVVNDILNINNLPSFYESELSSIMSSTTGSFSSIQPYLDRVDGNILVSYLIDMKAIAKANNGISEAEARAIEVYKDYVTKRTGYTFPSDSDSSSIDLTCTGCGAAMELDTSYSRAICPYCGNIKLMDESVVRRFLGI